MVLAGWPKPWSRRRALGEIHAVPEEGRPLNIPLLAVLARVRQRDNSMFAKWCELNGIASCPAAPAAVAKFGCRLRFAGHRTDMAGGGRKSPPRMSRFGLADPTLGGVAAAAINDVAGIAPPRAWPTDGKRRFKSLPYDLQVYVAAHEARREKEIRHAQNEAAAARQRLEAVRQNRTANIDGSKGHDVDEHEIDKHAAT